MGLNMFCTIVFEPCKTSINTPSIIVFSISGNILITDAYTIR